MDTVLELLQTLKKGLILLGFLTEQHLYQRMSCPERGQLIQQPASRLQHAQMTPLNTRGECVLAILQV